MEETSVCNNSDSADSLFLTQSVTSASRAVRRRHPSDVPFSQPSEDEQKTAQHGDTTAASDSDCETNFTGQRRRAPKSVLNKNHRRENRRHRKVLKTIKLPFLKKSDSGKLSVRENHILVNSEIGGFFKCIQKLSEGHGERSRRELSPSLLPPNWEQIKPEESDEDEDIRKVDMDCFIFNPCKRQSQTWLRFMKQKPEQKTRECTKKSKNSQDQEVKSSEIMEAAENLSEPQDTDTDNDSSSSNKEEPSYRKRNENSRTSTRCTRSLRSTASRPSPAKAPFVQSLFMDPDEKCINNQPRVLVQCSQSQSLDWQQTQKTDKARKNLIKPIDEMAVDETQWPSSDQDEDETQIVENNSTDKSGEDFGGNSGGFMSSQDLFQEPDNQSSLSKTNEEISESNVVLNDVTKDKRDSVISADDHVKCAQSQRTQSRDIISPAAEDGSILDQEKKEKDKITSGDISVAHMHPSSLECRVVLHDVMKNKNKRWSLILADTAGDHAKYSKSQITFKISPKAKDKDQERVEKDKKLLDDISVDHVPPSISDDHAKYSKSQMTREVLATAGDIDQEKDKIASNDISVEHVHPSSPLKDSVTGNNYSSPVEDVRRVRQEEKMDFPLFNYGGLTFLKRKKDEKTEAPGNTNNAPPIQADPNQNEGPAPHIEDTIMQKNSRNVTNDGLSENPTDTMPEISVPVEIIKDATVFSASVRGIEQKKKTKEDKNDGLLKEPVETLSETSASADSVQSVQDISVVCPSVGEKKDTNDGLLEEPIETLPETSASADSVQSVQDISVVCPSVGEKKRKKDTNDGLLEEPDDMHKVNISSDIILSAQDSLLDCASVGRNKPKKKKKKDKYGEPEPGRDQLTGEEACQIPCQDPASLLPINKEIKQLSRNDYSSHEVNQLDNQTQAHDELVQTDGLEPRKKKKKKTKKRDLSPEMADSMVASQESEEINVSAQSHLSVQDSSVDRASVGEGKRKKKRKKDKDVRLLEEPLQETSVSADTVLPIEDFSVDCAPVGRSKEKKKRKRDKTDECMAEPVDVLPEISISADSTSSVQDFSVGVTKPKKKRKRDKTDKWLVEPVDVLPEISISADSTSSMQDFSVGVTKPKKKRKRDKTDKWLVEPVDVLPEINISADSTSSVQDFLVGGSKPKKKRRKDRSAEPDEEEAIQIHYHGSASLVSITEETKQLISNAGYHVQSDGFEPQRKKKKKQKFRDEVEEQVEEVPTASKSLEPSDKTLEIQPVNCMDLMTDDSVTPRKKKKKKRKRVREENVDAEASSVEIQERVPTLDAEQQAFEVVQEKKKKKKDRSEARHEEEADASLSLGPEPGDTPTSNSPNTRSETRRTGEEEGLAKSKSAKKRKELESDAWSVSHGSEYLDDSYRHSRLEKQLTNDGKEGKKYEWAKSDGSESSQVLESKDTIPLERKKKKKKRLVEPDLDMCPEIVEPDLFQQNGSPSETPKERTKKKKKKKKRKDTFDPDLQSGAS